MPTAFEVEISVTSDENNSKELLDLTTLNNSNSSETEAGTESGNVSETGTATGIRIPMAMGMGTSTIAENLQLNSTLALAEKSLETELSEGMSRLLLDDTTRLDETRLDETRLDETTLSRDLVDLDQSEVQCYREDHKLDQPEIRLEDESYRDTHKLDQPQLRHEVESFLDNHEEGISKISKLISNFRERYPGKLKGYSSMTPTEKEFEHERIMKLLARLKIRKAPHDMGHENQPGPSENDNTASIENWGDNDLEDHSCESATDGCILPCQEEDLLEISQASSVGTQPHETSVTLLSDPSTGSGRLPSLRRPLCRKNSSASVSSSDSVEVARAATASPHYNDAYGSPDLRRQRSSAAKRLASTSGRRSTGKLRYKRSEGTTPSPSQFLRSPLDCYSPGFVQPFVASQSPISPHCRHTVLDDDSASDTESGMSVALEGSMMEHEDADTRDMIDSYGPGKGDSNRLRLGKLRDISEDVALKNGVPFHVRPLQVKRTKINRQAGPALHENYRPQFLSLPDPLDSYNGRESEQLNRIFSWMRERGSSIATASHARGIIFSLVEQQIIDVTMKLLLETQLDPSQMELPEDENTILGQTVIVTRSKDAIGGWERALREHTSFSVLNHSALSVRERKSPSTATKCATYDVVISTFDAIKSLDIALPLDDDGHVETQNIGCEDGWYVSRQGSQTCEGSGQCKQLSVLHRVNWRQVVFVDVLGRKCFLAKPETARASAARALNADSRFIFFQKSHEKSSPLETLIRSNRNALRSVASVLRIESEDPEETVLEMIVDKYD